MCVCAPNTLDSKLCEQEEGRERERVESPSVCVYICVHMCVREGEVERERQQAEDDCISLLFFWCCCCVFLVFPPHMDRLKEREQSVTGSHRESVLLSPLCFSLIILRQAHTRTHTRTPTFTRTQCDGDRERAVRLQLPGVSLSVPTSTCCSLRWDTCHSKLHASALHRCCFVLLPLSSWNPSRSFLRRDCMSLRPQWGKREICLRISVNGWLILLFFKLRFRNYSPVLWVLGPLLHVCHHYQNLI